MDYFNDELKDKVEDYFERIIEKVGKYLKVKGYEVEEWD